MTLGLLAITDGRPSFDATLRSLDDQLGLDVFDYRVIVDDSRSPAWARRLDETFGADFDVIHHGRIKLGFAGAIAVGWEHLGHVDEVWHQEDDWRFEAPVALDDLRAILDENPRVAQAALVRNAVNRAERASGGLLAHHRDEFADHRTAAGVDWLEHRAWFTTNPCLYRADVVRLGWPAAPESERKMTDRLRAQGRTFAYLGGLSDPPRVVHQAARSREWRA